MSGYYIPIAFAITIFVNGVVFSFWLGGLGSRVSKLEKSSTADADSRKIIYEKLDLLIRLEERMEYMKQKMEDIEKAVKR